MASFLLLTVANYVMAISLSVRVFARREVLIGQRVVGLALPIALYALLTSLYPRQPAADRETRCRNCRYILRGISEPRCPECGERI